MGLRTQNSWKNQPVPSLFPMFISHVGTSQHLPPPPIPRPWAWLWEGGVTPLSPGTGVFLHRCVTWDGALPGDE